MEGKKFKYKSPYGGLSSWTGTVKQVWGVCLGEVQSIVSTNGVIYYVETLEFIS